MYLWDSNILRHYMAGHENLQAHLQRIPWQEIALPSPVVAEVLRGRCDFALKAEPAQLPLAHAMLTETQKTLEKFHIIIFDQEMGALLLALRKKRGSHKRYPDMMIAAMALAGGHIVVTRNKQHFADLLPANQIANWIDDPA